MSDMYLTKVERKTIFTQGLIYVLFVFIISDLTVVGPHIFVIFPWLYILGIIGVNKFYHPVLTATLSCITTFMANLFKYNLEIGALTSTLTSTAVVICGIITGVCIKDFVLEYRLVKYMSWKKKMLNIAIIVVLTIVTLVSYSYQYGNIVNYIKSKRSVEEFVKEFSTDYNIEKYQYVSGTFGEYVYKVNILGEEVTLNVNDKVKIVNVSDWKTFLNNRINSKSDYLKSYIDCSLNYEFTDGVLKPNSIIATINLLTLEGKDNLEIKNVVNNIQSVLAYTDEFELNIDKCVLIIKENVQTLHREEFNLINVEYLLNNLKVENLEKN